MLGGTSSGKSAVAEGLAQRLTVPVVYVATAIVTDTEMAMRVRRHRDRRPPEWGLLEATGADLPAALLAIEGAVLVDALGTWVASFDDFEAFAAEQVAPLCRALGDRPGDTIVVSDEVGLGVHPSTDVGRRFRDAMGGLNTAVAGVADEVLLVIAGRVLSLDRPFPA